MKKFKASLAAFLAACALLGITGCSEKSENISSDNVVTGAADGGKSDQISTPNSSGDISSSDEGASSSGGAVIEKRVEPIELTDSNTENSIRLFDAISADTENAMFSPLSLNMALGLIEAGAKGETAAALDSYLQTENFSDFAEAYMKLSKEEYTFKGTYDDRNNVLEIGNSFWADHSLQLKTDYKQRMSEKFDAEIQSVEFSDKEKTLGKINGWVNNKTHKMIPKILDDYDPQTAAVLINTVYFESAWRDDWYVNDDNKEPFTLSDGTAKNIPLMYNGGGSYYENDKATAFSSRYMNGLEFIGILPKESGEFTFEELDIQSLLKSETFDYDVSAVMPRFSFDTSFKLKDALSAAGLANIFDEGSADFSGISDTELWVSEILQKTRIELDEYGTKAAAATAVIDATNAMPMPKELKTVRLDRPFAFMIYDSEQEQILFMGKVMTVDSE